MPYFYNNKVNLLLLHIPKTGGTSLEIYFSEKYNIPLNKKSLCTREAGSIEYFEGVSLQHQTYTTLKKYSKKFGIQLNGLKMLTVVRNPYERLVSDLFFNKLISVDNTKEEVESVIKKYLYGGIKHTKDNHVIPQYFFLVDEVGNINKKITILRQECLTKMMHTLGYTDFDLHKNISHKEKLNYFQFLSPVAIQLINKYYEKDFLYFEYTML